VDSVVGFCRVSGAKDAGGVLYGSRWALAKRETTGSTNVTDFPTAAAVADWIHAAWYFITRPRRGR